MMSERWQQIEALFQSALDREPSQRAAFLDQACASDPALRQEVESLVLAHERAGGFMEDLAAGVAHKWFTHEQAESVVGQKIGPYQILREIGHGGMGAVYLAARADAAYQKQVAIKLVRRGMDTEEILHRFRHERQILANLDHPNISKLLDGGTTEDGLSYFVMEYIDGLPIDTYCDTYKLSTVGRLKLFRIVCSAVHYAHQNLVIHRDLKPSNILVTADGVPKLMDFGIAKLLSPDLSAQTLASTATAMRLMTPEYASPEQIRGEPITTASDVYSLGVLLYELLTDHRPYRFKSHLPQEIERVICEEDSEMPSLAVSRNNEKAKVGATDNGQRTDDKLRRQLTGDLDTIVMMAVHKEPQRRYASAEQFSEDIRRHLEGLPVIARKDTLGYRAGKFIKRHKVGVAMAAAVVALVLSVGITMTVQSARIARERNKAVAAQQVAAMQRAEAERARDAEQQQRQRAEVNLWRAEAAEKNALAEAERANTEAKRANTEAARAKVEAETAKQVSDFLVGLFKVSDPSEAKGSTITAREILDKGADKIAKELQDQPEVQATLMDTMGRVYQSLGLYERAAPLLESALKIRRQTLDSNHPDVAQSLNNLALLMKEKGNYAAAEPLVRQALAIRRQLWGNEHRGVTESLNALAEILHDKGDYAGAEPLYREALAMRRKLLGGEHPDMVESLNNLALLLKAKGDYAGAEPLYREALALSRKLYGHEHPDVATTISNLALLLKAKGDDAAAEPLLREALAMRRQLLGDEHPSVAYSLSHLAGLLSSRGDYEAAEPLYREALATCRQRLGDEHPMVAYNLNGLAMLLDNKKDYAAAEPLYREAVRILRKHLGDDHPSVATGLNNLATMLHKKGDLAAAEPLLREALALRRQRLGDEHPFVATSLNNLASLLADRGDLAAAEPLFHQALQLQRKVLPTGHVDTAISLVGLGNLLLDKGDPKAAEPLLREGLEILRKALPEGHWRRAGAESGLGGCFVTLQRYDEAEPLLLGSYPILKTTFGDNDQRTRRALRRLIRLYDAWGNPDKAALYRTMLPPGVKSP